MAKKVYIAEFDAHGEPYFKKLNSMEEATNRSTKKIDSMFSKTAKAIGAYFTADIIKDFMVSSIDAFSKQEAAVKKLDVALGKNTKNLQAYATALQKVTKYADEEIAEVMARLSFYTKDEAMIKKLTKATLDFATAKGLDLVSAGELVAKTIGGETNALGRYGIQIEKGVTGTAKMNEVVESMAKLFGGQATSELETFGGQLQNTKNLLGEVEEAVGEDLTKAIQTNITDVTALSAAYLGLNESLKSFTGTGVMGNVLNTLYDFARGDFGGFRRQVEQNARMQAGKMKSSLSGGPGLSLLSQFTQGPITPGMFAPGPGGNGSGSGSGSTRITGGNTTRDARSMQMLSRGSLDANALGTGRFSREMTEVMVPELQSSFDDIGLSFVDKFSETQNIANNVGRIFNVSADSFVGKLLQAFDVGSSILSIIGSIGSLAGGGGIFGLLGLAEGGTVINKGGKLSYAPIPKFARGGSYTVPPGYANDSGLIRVQSGERVDVTPTSQVPMLGKLLGEIKSSIQAGNMNSARRGKQPIVVNVTLDSKDVTKGIKRNENRLNKGGFNFNEL
jgi:hypothetical protein